MVLLQKAKRNFYRTESYLGQQRTGTTARVADGWLCRVFFGKYRPENVMLIFTLIAVALGSLVGVLLNPQMGIYKAGLSMRQKKWLRLPGDMFLRMLKMLILPLIVSSNVSSIASLNSRGARWLAGISILYIILTSIIAVIVGIALVLIIQPGYYRDPMSEQTQAAPVKGTLKLLDSVMDMILNFIPENVIKATLQKDSAFESSAKSSQQAKSGNESNATIIPLDEQPDLKGTNILGLIIFAILFGLAVRSLGSDIAVLLLRRATIYLVSIAMWFSPVGICCLIAAEIAKENDLMTALENLCFYVATVLTGLFIHGAILLPLILYLVTRRNPLKFTYQMLESLMCAMGTASSTATLPCTIRCLEHGAHIDPRVIRFLLPLGTTINMNGTIMYEAIAVIYIAQRLRWTLDLGDIFNVGLTSVLAGMSAASMPSAGLLTMTMVLMAVGLPSSMINVILPVDWFLDRFRTMINVYGDAVGAAIVAKLCETRLNEEPCNEASLPPVEQVVAENVGGLKDVNLKELDNLSNPMVNTLRRKSAVDTLSVSMVSDDAGVESGAPPSGISGMLTPKSIASGVVPQQATVFVVDEETIILRF